MKKIAVVEAMDLIQEDIIRTFKGSYLGRVKNTADNPTAMPTKKSMSDKCREQRRFSSIDYLSKSSETAFRMSSLNKSRFIILPSLSAIMFIGIISKS